MATRVGVLDRGRLVLQEELAVLTAPTGATVVTTPEPGRVRATLDGRVDAVDGDRVVVRGADPAEVNARLVAAGVRGHRAGPERPTLEQVVLAAAGASTDRVDGAVIVVELRKLFRRPRTWATIGVLNAAADRRRDPARGHRPGAAAGAGSGVPVGRAHQRRAVPARRARHRAAAVPADRGRGGRRGLGRRRGAGRHPALSAGPAGRAAPGCWSRSWSRVLVFVLVTVLIVAAVGYLIGVDAVRGAAGRRAVGVGHAR